MCENTFLNTPDSVINALQQQVELTCKILDSFPDMSSYYITSHALSFPAQNIANQIAEFYNFISTTSGLSSSFLDNIHFIEDITFQDGYIELTESSCNSINSLLSSSNEPDSPPIVSKGKMALVDFIKVVFIPILALLLPMLQTSYYNHVDSIESQKEQEYREHMLQVVTEIQNSLNEIQEYHESHPCNCSDAPALQDEESADKSDTQSPDDSAE